MDLVNDITQHLAESQQRRNEKLTRAAALAPFIAAPAVRTLPPESPIWRDDTTQRSAAADADVTLSVSPFPCRPPTIVFLPFDRPWDGDPQSADPRAYAEPAPMLSSLVPFHAGTRRTVPRDGPYAALRFAMPTGAVRFSTIVATLERAGFTEEKKSLLATSWSVKWCKHPTRSDFVRLRPHQRVNHFPGTWRLGKKDTLHQHLLAAREKWQRSGNDNFGDIFPEGWVLPEDQETLLSVLRAPEECGNLFIVKPTTSACGNGIYLLSAHEQQELPQAIIPTGEKSAQRSTGRLVVQRYIKNPLLVEGFKFDLRIYVVVTSYRPLRAYMYEEGLVRFATTAYPTHTDDSNAAFTDASALTAHLTNFTLNKKSEDFVSPNSNSASFQDGGGALASKWTLGALREHFATRGLDWPSTMRKVHDLLVKVLLSVEPHVAAELETLQQRSPDGPPAPSVHIGSHCFEVYGADVLLREATDQTHGVAPPVLMEMNVMPSLSTHYSPLDQCVKGNLVADTLTLAGITPFGVHKRKGQADHVSYGHPFLDTLTDAVELEACLTAEEEFERRTHFFRLCPTAESYEQFKPLFESDETEAEEGRRRSLNEVLSAWEKAKRGCPPAWAHSAA